MTYIPLLCQCRGQLKYCLILGTQFGLSSNAIQDGVGIFGWERSICGMAECYAW